MWVEVVEEEIAVEPYRRQHMLGVRADNAEDEVHKACR
jgi:hypothetical protein